MAQEVTVANLATACYLILVDEKELPRIQSPGEVSGIGRLSNPLDPMVDNTLMVRIFRRLGYDIGLARGSGDVYGAFTDGITDPDILWAIEIIKYADTGYAWYAVWANLDQRAREVAARSMI